MSALVRAELAATGWEVFSSVLFVSAVVPAALITPYPVMIFAASLALSAALARTLLVRGVRGFTWAGAIRVGSWTVAALPLVRAGGLSVLVPALLFGLMAGSARRVMYRRLLDPEPAMDLGESLRARLGEDAMMAGIAGGHALLLFCVAFLRTKSQVVLEAWLRLVPSLGLIGTLGFTLALRPATRATLKALRAGPRGDPALLQRGLAEALRAPTVLSTLNFVVWVGCTAMGVFLIRPGPVSWQLGDAIMQLAVGLLFSWGVAFYQREWHKDTIAPVVSRLCAHTGSPLPAEPTALRSRLLREFGLPLVFMAAVSFLSSIGMYRALREGEGVRADLEAVAALVLSVTLLCLASLGVVARAARALSKPMTDLAAAADKVAKGHLDAAVPEVEGSIEVVGLGASVERMREALASTIAALSAERAGLEEKVTARTAELQRTLDELRRTQSALIQGERMAALGELVAGVAHEVNNPLNAIAGASEPLDGLARDVREVLMAYRDVEKDLPEDRRRAIEALRARLDIDATVDDIEGISKVIQRATARSVTIVQNLKRFSRAPGEAAPVDLHEGIDETLLLLKPRLAKADIRTTVTRGEIPLVVCAMGEINQIFMNLLVNAIQAMEGEGQARPREIWVETGEEAGSVWIAIEDTGPGVPEGLSKRVFDPFFTTKPRGQGTGLGLSISTEIARRHGGTLALTPPRHGDGARFVCRLPAGSVG